jgi:hypothetical protein
MEENKLLEAALRYAKRGWYVFPTREKPGKPYIDKNGKEKICKEKTPYTFNGFKEATLDEEKIRKWWEEHPEAMIGISCGDSKLFVIDVDTHNGKQGMQNYMKLGIDDSGALHTLTPSGGLHLIFSGVGRSATSILEGVDTRGIGGYIIAPPSKVLEGNTTGNYIALDDWSKDPVEIPSDLLKRLHVAKEKKQFGHKNISYNQPQEEVVEKARLALEKLPRGMCNNYQDWIDVGMSLYELGLDGLLLWDSWSKLSNKYQDGACAEKWETFQPDEISIGSLFFWAKERD